MCGFIQSSCSRKVSPVDKCDLVVHRYVGRLPKQLQSCLSVRCDPVIEHSVSRAVIASHVQLDGCKWCGSHAAFRKIDWHMVITAVSKGRVCKHVKQCQQPLCTDRTRTDVDKQAMLLRTPSVVNKTLQLHVDYIVISQQVVDQPMVYVLIVKVQQWMYGPTPAFSKTPTKSHDEPCQSLVRSQQNLDIVLVLCAETASWKYCASDPNVFQR